MRKAMLLLTATIAVMLLATGVALAATAPTFVTKWGSPGPGDGQFNTPYHVATDADGNVYVADFNNHRLQKFDSNGVFIAKWGSNGTGDGQFNSPMGIAIDTTGNVYVADFYNHRIQKFGPNGAFIAKWGSNGTGDGQF